MNRLLSAVLLAFFLSFVPGCLAAEPELKVAIVIQPGRELVGSLHWGDAGRGPHFHVLLTNVSTAAVYLPEKEGSVFFDLTDENGQTSRVIHLPYASHPPAIWTLQPQESAIIDVYFTDREAWGDGFWPGPGHPTGRYALKAYYEAGGDEFPHKFHVWAGLVGSPPVTCIIK